MSSWGGVDLAPGMATMFLLEEYDLCVGVVGERGEAESGSSLGFWETRVRNVVLQLGV